VSGTLRLVLADDDEGIRKRLRMLLEEDFELVAVVGDGRSAVEAVSRCKAELAILDMSMPHLNGIENFPGGQRIKSTQFRA
jgi:CheY-like chemotaxis protein